MTLLRQQMIDAMTVRGFSPRTHQSYLYAVSQLAAYYRRPPDQISIDDIGAWFLYLVKERGLSDASCRLYLNGLRFFYLQVLRCTDFDVPIPVPKRAQRIPELLTRNEVGRIFAACGLDKHRMMLICCYGCGLRVSELVAIRVCDIDGERHLLRVVQGKGHKDRAIIIPPSLLGLLRQYWQQYRPEPWLFPNQHDGSRHLSITTAQKAYTRAKRKAGIVKSGGIHALRHAYATHQLTAGLPIHQLQQLMGHRNIHSTLRYAHWIPGYQTGEGAMQDLIAQMEVAHV